MAVNKGQYCTIFSVRINGKNTTFSIKNKILSFYTAIAHKKGNYYDFLQDAVNDILKDYDKDDFKGLSDYVVDKLLLSLLRKKQKKVYKRCLERLEL